MGSEHRWLSTQPGSRPFRSCFQLKVSSLHLTKKALHELCGERSPSPASPAASSRLEDDADHPRGVGGVVPRASSECLGSLHVQRSQRDTAVSKEFGPEKLNQMPGAHLAAPSNPLWCPPPTNKPQEKPGVIILSVPMKLTHTRNARLVCVRELGIHLPAFAPKRFLTAWQKTQ